ncbi:MAG TPA: metallophosphoesterase [Candidatus Parabacteroides intestinipullorum]|uniref:Metallophosphoesterase n=1 Tax=Candidatus Parabacteroides intestinipullorum TaxID=2838723 RepID=A0A9D1X915_9BACT|nr:metallophosphoesterase [Candidatus Parabacteroides intestinipullorum]
MKNRKFILTALFACLILLGAYAQKSIAFKEGKLKIVQLTDIHWDPQSKNCAQTAQTIEAVLALEKPDIAMLTGDVVTERPGPEGWKAIIALLEKAQVPFTVMMGNHDAEVMPKREIYDLLAQSPYFIGEKGPETIHGCGNYVVPVYGADHKTTKALLYCIDSNDYPESKDYGTYDWIHFDQVAWYRQTSARFTKENGGNPLPALAFFHIALPEYDAIPNNGTMLGEKNEGSGASKINSGLFASFIEMGDVMGAFVGHDHDNDFIGTHYQIALAYGRVTGTDAYGDLERGMRVIELKENERSFDTWVRTPSKKGDIFYYPSGLTSLDEEQMSYLPATTTKAGKPGVAYTYYEGKFKSTADVLKAKPVKEGTFRNFSIKEAAADDHFGYQFRSQINIPEKGVYKFHIYSDDGARLFIDGQEVIDNDGSHSAGEATGKVALEKGFHEIRVIYFEDYMGQALEIGITGKNLPKQVLPDEMLFLPE